MSLPQTGWVKTRVARREDRDYASHDFSVVCRGPFSLMLDDEAGPLPGASPIRHEQYPSTMTDQSATSASHSAAELPSTTHTAASVPSTVQTEEAP